MDAPRSLVQRAVDGDRDALTELLAVHHDALHARVNAQIGRRYQAAFSAEDVLQVTYLEAFLRIGRFEPDGDGAFANWLDVIATNNIKDSIRELDRKRRPPRHRQVGASVADDSYACLLASLPGSQSTPSQGVSRAEVRELIEDALSTLPPDYARVIRGFDLECRGVGELAAELDCSKGAVYMLRSRAHDWLAEILGESTRFFN